MPTWNEVRGDVNGRAEQQMLRLLKAFGQTKSLCCFRQGSFSFFGKFLSFFGPVLTIVCRVREQAVIAFFLFIFKGICRIQICFSKMFAFLHFCHRIKVFCTIFLTLNSEILFNVICTTGEPPQQFRKIFDCLI